MEHAQRVWKQKITMELLSLCLNPYFNGTCSKSARLEQVDLDSMAS